MEKFNGNEKENICIGDFEWCEYNVHDKCIIYNGDKNMTIMYVHKKWRAIMVLNNKHFTLDI
jgi:hypothetical protein